MSGDAEAQLLRLLRNYLQDQFTEVRQDIVRLEVMVKRRQRAFVLFVSALAVLYAAIGVGIVAIVMMYKLGYIH
jgi:hypothetical protein